MRKEVQEFIIAWGHAPNGWISPDQLEQWLELPNEKKQHGLNRSVRLNGRHSPTVKKHIL
jgi:hypothetical protein